MSAYMLRSLLLFVLPTLFSVCISSSALADDDCKAALDATTKVIVTPSHAYNTKTAEATGNKPEQSEIIYTGGPNGAIYVMVRGKWTRSRLTPADMVEQKKENMKDAKFTCHHIRDESVNGEAAAVYSAHQDTEDAKIDSTIWVSKSKGLPLREEIDINVGGAQGKSHTSTRFEYSNVKPPAL